MIKTGLVAICLLLFQKPPETGIIAGTLALPPGGHAGSRPARVVLLSEQLTNIWNGDLQRRLDAYWERYKPAFAQNKEYFLEVSRLAQRESFNYILARMRRDDPQMIASCVKEIQPGGKFEFRNVAFGDYKILAMGAVGNQDFVWEDDVQVKSSIPQFLELKNH